MDRVDSVGRRKKKATAQMANPDTAQMTGTQRQFATSRRPAVATGKIRNPSGKTIP
jgi:hypothetical protein